MSVTKIHFYNEGIDFVLRQKAITREWITKVATSEGYKIKSLNYIFCSDEALLEINRTYLNHDTYTDIITFDNSENQGTVEGEIYVSVDRVRENAKQFQAEFNTELNRVLIHGILHLCGYKDKTKAEELLMRTKENQALALFDFIAKPTSSK